MTFNHIEIDYPSLSRETVDGVRYYDTPNGKKLVSITSVISHYNREIFREWRAKVGEQEANKVTKQQLQEAQIYTLEYYLKNSELPSVQPLSEMLFNRLNLPWIRLITFMHKNNHYSVTNWVWLVVLTVSLNMKVS